MVTLLMKLLGTLKTSMDPSFLDVFLKLSEEIKVRTFVGNPRSTRSRVYNDKVSFYLLNEKWSYVLKMKILETRGYEIKGHKDYNNPKNEAVWILCRVSLNFQDFQHHKWIRVLALTIENVMKCRLIFGYDPCFI